MPHPATTTCTEMKPAHRHRYLQPLLALLGWLLATDASAAAEGASDYSRVVADCLRILAQDGTDHYGAKPTPVLASILDVETRQCPSNPAASDEAWRVVRRERRNPAGANLLTDLATLKAMYFTSQRTGDATFSQFADRYIGWYLDQLVDDRGFIWWGWHRHYDVFTDKMSGHLGNPHEIHATQEIPWERLWTVNSNAVRREIEAIWQWHVIDKRTGEIDRHGDGVRGCDFAMSAGAIIEAFAFLQRQTGEKIWHDRARLVADYYWERRNPVTDLFPERPNASTNRFDGAHFLTSSAGLFCHALLKSSQLTGDHRFREQAVTYLRAYGRFGYDTNAGKFWGSLKLDGTPVPGPRVAPPPGKDSELKAEEYGIYEPRGYLDLWQPYAAGYEHPIATAQVYAYAALTTGDPELRTAAERFARWIRQELPPRHCETNTWYRGYAENYAPHGTYAGLYGQTISIFLQMYLLTGETEQLQSARTVADEAIARLNCRGLFRGHPAKPYYEAMDGVGQLLYALLQLDSVVANPSRALKARQIVLKSDGKTVLPPDNW